MEGSEDSNDQRATVKQREVMIAFMREHPALYTGRFSTIHGTKHRARLLREFSDRLNAVGSGGTKTPDKWMKCWQDWKSDVKKKAAITKRRVRGTGGGPASCLQQTRLEANLAIMGPVTVTGHNTTDPLDAQRLLVQERPASHQCDSVPVDANASTTEVLHLVPVSEWLDFERIPSDDSVLHTKTTPLPRLSPETTDTSDLESPGSKSERPRKRRLPQLCSSFSKSQAIMVRNADNLAWQVELKKRRLNFEMKKFEHEKTMRERELAASEKMTQAAIKSASAMESIASALTAAMQAFQSCLQKQ